MKQMFWRALALWGLVDCLWLAIDPPGWSQFWGDFILGFGSRPTAARTLAVVRAAFCVGLLAAASRSRSADRSELPGLTSISIRRLGGHRTDGPLATPGPRRATLAARPDAAFAQAG
jgi:hypothetical protein